MPRVLSATRTNRYTSSPANAGENADYDSVSVAPSTDVYATVLRDREIATNTHRNISRTQVSTCAGICYRLAELLCVTGTTRAATPLRLITTPVV
jgi:hypothetical protein